MSEILKRPKSWTLIACAITFLVTHVDAAADYRFHIGSTGTDVSNVQHGCNVRIRNLSMPLMGIAVDGHWGIESDYTCKKVAYYLGADRRTLDDGPYWVGLQVMVTHPNSRAPSTARNGTARRRDFTRDYEAGTGRDGAYHTDAQGTAWVNGYPVPYWIVPYVKYARAHGWHGEVTSGFRSDTYQWIVCNTYPYPRPCATPGYSMHRYRGSASHTGAVDVTDPYGFGDSLRGNMLPGRLIHFQPPAYDPPHWSSSGH